MSAEADAVASMLQLASNTQEQLPQQTQDRDAAQDHEDDVEMDNRTESSLSELEDRVGSDVEDLEDDDLSDPGDEEEEDEDEVDGLEDRDETEARNDEADDGDDDGEDTEAETERLHESPDKLRTSRSVHHRAEDQLQLPDDNIDQTSEISALTDSPTGDMSPLESSPRKRKRDTADTGDEDEDDTRQSLRQVSRRLEGRRAQDEEDAEEFDGGNEEQDLVNGKDEEDAGSGDDRASSKENTPDAETLTKATSKDDAEASGGEDVEETGGDTEAKGEEDTVKKETALSSLRIMEKDFARLRDEMFASRMQQLNHELEQLQHDPMSHPEYAAAMDAIDRRRDEQVRQARATLDYKIKSLQNRSVAERAMAHSQYVQEVAQIRDACLEQAGNEWYRIQKARRQGDDSEFEQRFHYDTDRTKQVARQTAYNMEVSILSGVQKYVGFPAAPAIDGVGVQEAEEDLRRMGITVSLEGAFCDKRILMRCSRGRSIIFPWQHRFPRFHARCSQLPTSIF